MSQRLIELYVGEHTGDSCGTWYVADVYVDADLEQEDAVEVAIGKFFEQTDSEWVAFVGLYCFWDDDMMEEEDWDDDEEEEWVPQTG